MQNPAVTRKHTITACLLIAALFGASLLMPTRVGGGQTGIEDYREARGLFWSELYSGGGETLYCGREFTSGRHRKGLNIEHVMPMAWVMNELDCETRKLCRNKKRFNQVEADMHNLYPSRVDLNKERSSFRFGIVKGERRRFGKCDFEVDYRARVVEPREPVRGEVARAMFYMSNEYGVAIFPKATRLLKQWHRADPPSEDERRRNDVIEQLQGTRNKFIDEPGLVGRQF
ncbi:MAG: endonuclease I family protein [Gammaproteobacteria bacterium]